MSEAVLIALIAAVVPTLLATAATFVISLRNSRKLDEVKNATNGMKDALVEATRIEAIAIGKAEGVEKERVRTEAIASSTNP